MKMLVLWINCHHHGNLDRTIPMVASSFVRNCGLFKVKILLYTSLGLILLSVLILSSARPSFHFKSCLAKSFKSAAMYQQLLTLYQVFHQTEERWKYAMLNATKILCLWDIN